ncbi:coadhesin-like [Sycon ciliatum]|uniref:coadhesin-like n=1 Tax=Sycon ciliatum TaxID=27933 RepID=UPI0031F68EBC
MACFHGGWSDWSEFGDCIGDCGEGAKESTRTCTKPRPAHGGRLCDGPSTRTAPCPLRECPSGSNGWGPWGQFGPCSAACGAGGKIRERPCLKKRADNSYSCVGPFREEHYCMGECQSGQIDCSAVVKPAGDNAGSASGEEGSGSGNDADGSGNRKRRSAHSGYSQCCIANDLAYDGKGKCCPLACPIDDDDCELESSASGELGSGASGSGDGGSGQDGSRRRRRSAGGCRPIKDWKSRSKRSADLHEMLRERRTKLPGHPVTIERTKRHPESVDEEFEDDDYFVANTH